MLNTIIQIRKEIRKDTVEQAKEEISKILYDKELVERKFKRKVEMKIFAVANVPQTF